MNKTFVSVIAAALGAGFSVATAADISGVIMLKGTPPLEKEFSLIKNDPNCSKLYTTLPTTHHYLVGPKGELANVFVTLKGISGKSTGASAPPVVLDQKGCLYVPQILAIQTGQKLVARNSDPVGHNVHPMPVVAG